MAGGANERQIPGNLRQGQCLSAVVTKSLPRRNAAGTNPRSWGEISTADQETIEAASFLNLIVLCKKKSGAVW
jgi:hypothetical protein